MRYPIYLTTLLLITLNTFAQTKLDSLKAGLKSEKHAGRDSSISIYLANIGWEFLSRRAYDSALYYYYATLADETVKPTVIASTLDCIGVAYNYKGYPDSSILYYNNALRVYRELLDTTHVIAVETNLSIIYKNQGLYEKALESAFSALNKLEKKSPDRALASCYNTIGSVYIRMKEYEEALRYFRQALDVRRKINYVQGVGQSYNNIGEAFIQMGVFDSAVSNLQKALLIKQSLGDVSSIGTTMNLLGIANYHMKQYKTALYQLTSSATIKRKLEERLSEGVALNNLAMVQIATGNYNEAERNLYTAEALVRDAGGLDELRQNLELRVRLFTLTNEFRRALTASHELLVVKDSLLTKERIKSLTAMQIRYETEKKEQQIAFLQTESEFHQAESKAKNAWIWMLAVLAIAALVIIILAYTTLRATQRKKSLAEMFSRELHHRVKNYLQMLSSIFSLQAQQVTDSQALSAVKSSEGRINAMSLIHKKLYNVEQNRSINIRDYVTELLEYLKYAYGFNNGALRIELSIPDYQLDVDRAMPLGLILNELISNAFKHAFGNQPEPALEIMFNATPYEVTLHISDNGKGMQDVMVSENSFGLKMVKAMIKDLKGTFSIDGNSGTRYEINFPLSPW